MQPNGVVGVGTHLMFTQVGDRVLGRYSGGKALRGCLIGRIRGVELAFRYLQREGSGELHGVQSRCEFQERHDGRLRLIEHFDWSTRPGSGVNTFDEILPSG